MIKLKNFSGKRAQTFKSLLWLFGLLTLFIIALGVFSSEMNSTYSTNKDLTYGILTNETYEGLQKLQADLDTDVRGTEGGQAGYSTLGILTLTKLPKMLWNLLGVMLNFATGGWIENSIGQMGIFLGPLGTTLVIIARVLFTMFIIFIIIKLLTRSPT